MLAEQPSREERRKSARHAVTLAAELVAGELTIRGEVQDLSSGGAFFQTQLLIEVGERGVLEVDGVPMTALVVWLRGNIHDEGPGMGLLFEAPTSDREGFHARFVSERA